ncbi:cholesterol transporter ABCA5-like isoform X2 [Mya arenaria]|uniref:cholesterol transporter ABCA5-like isoform X2 n=1 Tax=Mya arenaria TaxID=6604 RepID=UPI0022E48C68|nr:cholesterol transporter ABCA5-like isoform X2 [Mya arenaria]
MAGATWFGQFKAITWKTLLLKRRNMNTTFWEFFSPVMYVAILAAIKGTIVQDPLPQFGGFPDYNIQNETFVNSFLGETGTKRLLVTPDDLNVQAIMTEFSSIFNATYGRKLNIEYFQTKTDAENEFLNNSTSVLAGIIFNYGGRGNMSYALRYAKDSVPSSQYSGLFTPQSECRRKDGDTQVNDNGLQHDGNCKVNYYWFNGFVQLQTAIDAALIKNKYGVSYSTNNISVQMLPKPAFQADNSWILIMSSMYFVLAYLPLVSYFTVALVAEKEKKIKEGMKMMGLKTSVFWISAFSVFMVTTVVVTVIVTIIAVAASFLPNSNYGLFFIFLIIYGISMISLACMLAPFFNKAMSAGVVASMATMITSCLYLAVSLTRKYEAGTGSVSYSIPVYGRWLMCLLSPVAFALGMDQGIYLDLNGGLTAETARHGEFPFVAPLCMLLLDSILYFLLAIYFDNIIPGEYGPRRKPYYIFQPSYWCSGQSHNVRVSYSNGNLDCEEIEDMSGDGVDVEPVPANMKSKVAVRIKGLTKIYKSTENKKEEVKAVNNLSLNMYEGQITAILGHNGAGKTTLMNILTGMTSATSGSAKVKGLDVSNSQDIELLRSMTGVCPQHNTLFDELTCYEHLRLFGGIKGILDVDKEIDEALESVDLGEQKNVRASNLSGGQKRKLSVAISIIGDPKIIFLDEPTAGMDPYARRCLWETLKNKKAGRVILLTTHFMDEADILADRKAIVNKGSLRCCGSSFYLKNKFGIGYHLNMVVEPDSDSCRIGDLVSEVISGSEVNRVHDLFSKLENKATAKSLGIKNFGISMTTLEEVFLKLEEDVEDVELEEREAQVNDTSTLVPPRMKKYGSAVNVNITGNSNPSDTVECVTGSVLARQRLWAIFITVFRTHLRNFMANLFGVIMPVVLVVVGIVLSKNLQSKYENSGQEQESLGMSPAYYMKMIGSTSQTFPYNTVPKLLMRDNVNTTMSSSFVSGLSSTFQTDSTLDPSYFTDMYTLLQKGVAPHYIGFQINQLAYANQILTSAYKVFYNDSAVSSIPVAVNLYSNSLLTMVRTITGNTENSTLEVSSFPWPDYSVKKQYNGGAFASTLLVGMAFSFITGGIGVDLVRLRQWKVRSQLRVSGMPFSLYYLGIFLVHAAKIALPGLVTIILVLALRVQTLLNGGAILSFLLTCLFYIPPSILFPYCLSFLFVKWESASSVLPILVILTGYLPYIPISILDMVLTSDVPAIIHYIFCVIDPPYLVFGGLYHIDKVYQTAALNGRQDKIEFGDYFTFSSRIPIVWIMAVIHTILLFFLLRVFDIRKSGGDVSDACFPNREHSGPLPNNDVIQGEDDDVKAERTRVNNLLQSSSKRPVAVVENLRREFQKGAEDRKCCAKGDDAVKVAVRNQTFAVEAGEVFGLLGPNGAGKTTTLNMMIADVAPTGGQVLVSGYDIRSEISEAFQMVGYCPQHDALIEQITLREHLVMYARVRGIPSDRNDEIVDYYIDNLKLKEHENKWVEKLSGGTKRKLSYCMSMLGRPRIVLLDEPSTGMDPQSKRFLWDTISESFESSERGAILTTHYMEEADALCSRIAIMVNGKMECLGSSQHLKNKYGSGYLLEVKLKSSEDQIFLSQNIERLHDYIRKLFPGATVMEQFSERIQYRVPKSNVISLSRTFQVLEDGKTDYEIAEYSFSQATLEQVFLEFARKQMDENLTVEEVEAERTRSIQRATSLEGASPQHTAPYGRTNSQYQPETWEVPPVVKL